jgi:hypothetical protein
MLAFNIGVNMNAIAVQALNRSKPLNSEEDVIFYFSLVDVELIVTL